MFQVRKASKDGYTASCKACLKERDRIRDQDPNRKAAKEKYVKGKGKDKADAAKNVGKKRIPRSVVFTF